MKMNVSCLEQLGYIPASGPVADMSYRGCTPTYLCDCGGGSTCQVKLDKCDECGTRHSQLCLYGFVFTCQNGHNACVLWDPNWCRQCRNRVPFVYGQWKGEYAPCCIQNKK